MASSLQDIFRPVEPYIQAFLTNDLAVLGAGILVAFFLGIYALQWYYRNKDEKLFETVDFAEDVLAPVLRSDMGTWGEKCRVKFMQDFELKYYAIKKKRFNVVSNLEEKLDTGKFEASKKMLKEIKNHDDYQDGVMVFKFISPMLTQNFKINYLIYLILEGIVEIKRVSWLAVIPKQWLRYSSDAVQLHKDAQFFELVDGIHYAESLEVWKAFTGVHYSELHENVLTSFNNQYEYINKFYPEHGMELEEIKAQAEAERKKYQRDTVKDVND